jgi:hypothetical protein
MHKYSGPAGHMVGRSLACRGTDIAKMALIIAAPASAADKIALRGHFRLSVFSCSRDGVLEVGLFNRI